MKRMKMFNIKFCSCYDVLVICKKVQKMQNLNKRNAFIYKATKRILQQSPKLQKELLWKACIRPECVGQPSSFARFYT